MDGSGLIAVVGPTAVGKSNLALRLALSISGWSVEIINADSRQVYRHMDIGTGKPSAADRSIVPHHLYDLVDPDGDFNLALYKKVAYKTIQDVLRRGKVPLLVGGSGLYVWSVLENWTIPEAKSDPEFRRSMEEKARVDGAEALHKQLRAIDPAAAGNIAPTNVRRVVRALEIYRITGFAPSQLRRKGQPPFHPLVLGLTMERSRLYDNINKRVDAMVQLGLVDEVRILRSRGYGLELPAMSSIGYREITAYLRGEMDMASALERIKAGTHRLARHQYAWFKPGDRRISWFDGSDGADKPVLAVHEFLANVARGPGSAGEL